MNSNDQVLAQPDSANQPGETEPQPVVESSAPASDAEAQLAESPMPETALEASDSSPEETESVSDEALFLAALNDEMPAGTSDDFMLTPLQRGAIIKGTIASKTDSEIMIDVGAKSEGMISGRELDELDQESRDALTVGQEIWVYVSSTEDRNGHAQLSLRRAMEEQDWIDAERYMTEAEVYESKVTGFNKGGLIVRFGKVRGFVPASQVSRDRRRRGVGTTPEERWSPMIGEDISIKVIEVDRGRNRLILSERAAAREQRAEKRSELLETLQVGQVHTGRVISLADFGAFVDLGGADGLIHLSELSWRHVSHPREVLKVGDEVEVEIIHVDQERQRIGLSHKNRLEDPWDVLAANYAPDQLVQATITKLTKFGAFARLVEHPEIEGLIHISELSDRRVEHPREVVSEEEILTLRIIRIDAENRRMGLSLKRVDSEEYLDGDWRAVVDDANDGDAAEPMANEEEAAGEEVAAEVVQTDLVGDLSQDTTAEAAEPVEEDSSSQDEDSEE